MGAARIAQDCSGVLLLCFPSAPVTAMAQTTDQAQKSAVHLPPQLAAALGDHASSVAELCFAAPGTPWTSRLLDDLLADLRHENAMIAECEANGACVRAFIHLRLSKGARKQPSKETLEAYVHGKRSTDQIPMYGWCVFSAPSQPVERAGLRRQMEWCQQTANGILRRGFCDRCYDNDPPAKRLRVGGTQDCGCCLFSRSLRPGV